MPLTPAAIAQATLPATLDYAGETVKLTYRPAAVEAITKDALTAWDAEVTSAGGDREALRRVLADKVASLVATWDVVESVAEDGTLGPVVPLSVDRLAQFDTVFLMALIRAVLAAANAGK